MEKSFCNKKKFFLMLFIIFCHCLIAQNVQVVQKSSLTETDKRDVIRPEAKLQINIWHGQEQMVGHLGHAQDDFNLIGNVVGFETLAFLSYCLNGNTPIDLTIGCGKFGDTRRLAAPGDFNADIPISRLREGRNTILVNATDTFGNTTSINVYVEKLHGNYPLPVHIDWDKVDDPQKVGQYVDGKWALEDGGLRTVRTGYDRVFLIGDTSWKDYEVVLPLTFHRADSQTGPVSGGNGVGILMRFSGHVTGGPRNFPAGQPKWGYQPFGAIGLLRWNDGADNDPSIQFYRGDNDQSQNFGTISLVPGHQYRMKMRCTTLADDGTEGVTRYSFKIWKENEMEPGRWNWEVEQKSQHALKKGGVVLLAHHVDATFGNVHIVAITSTAGK